MASVSGPRALIARRPGMVALLFAAALLLRLLVPAGFMPTSQGGRLAVTLCSGAPAPHAMRGMAHHEPAPTPDGRCAFADLAMPVPGEAVAPALALPAPIVAALGERDERAPPPRAPPRLHPPARGPPLPV
jgi:hypothetical protein